jgi:HK97 family phage prohead protease
MDRKTITGPVTFKADGDEGQFRAVFATLGVVDHDGDVTVPGAFTDGEKVRISYWGHRWGDLPVGRGEIHADDNEAWVDGKFFLDTEGGRETYATVKALSELQEWSYGFDVLERGDGQLEGQPVQFLKRLKVHEVSPVMLGAGVGTRTTAIKAKDRLEEVGKALEGMSAEDLQAVHDRTIALGAKAPEREDSAVGGEGNAEGETGSTSKPSGPGPSTLRVRIDAELLEFETEEV